MIVRTGTGVRPGPVEDGTGTVAIGDNGIRPVA
jgi:hypothetical protein